MCLHQKQRKLCIRSLVPLVIVLSVSGFAADAPAAERQKAVLALYGSRPDLPANVIVDEIIRSALERELGARLDFYAEFLDTARWPEGEIQIAVHDFLMQPKAAQRAGYCSTHILEASIAGSISHCASSTTLTFSRTNSIPGNLILHASMSVISCYRIASSAFRMS